MLVGIRDGHRAGVVEDACAMSVCVCMCVYV